VTRLPVSPCPGLEGDLVEFYQRKTQIAAQDSDASCVAPLRVKVTRTTKFLAVSPMLDEGHLAGSSRLVRVRVLGD
jgi:hypothetical protein